ncbi:MAG: diacylglycerol/lipid kinase family protein, partial [Geminicoccaceae bacterium]
RVNPDLKRFMGKGAYLYETMKRIASFSPPTYHLCIDDREQQAHGVIIANGRFYAGRYVTAPDAHIEKPSLEVCRLGRAGRSAAARYLLSLFLGRLAARADVGIDQATKLNILGPAGAPVQADGDVVCRLPASVRVLPAAVDLVFPRTSHPRSATPANGKTTP